MASNRKKRRLPRALTLALSGLVMLAHTLSLAAESTLKKFDLVELTPGSMLTSSKAPDRDPFNWPTTQRLRLRQMAEAEQDIFADFVLQGIVWSSTIPQAVINSQLVTIGTMVDGAKVTDISQTRVWLSKNGRTHTMQFDTLDIDFGTPAHAKGNANDSN